ncbi:TolC family protein [Pontibacillus sp. HMF3514]|uniref:TolC family protein n=1 Tax=Pontibacillus sp. HMF3514 TaxID=2692425 RepID=UPI00131FED12|nr:TolC family protein [Pontibacillus sp. HMF3514]QHE53762.1 TolC family protein [Pontibacillus sp. HMF3514]
MKGKRIAIITAAVLTLPIGMVAGAQLESLNFKDAVNQIEKNDPNKIINASKPEISEDSQPYQGEFSDELDRIQETQNNYQDAQNIFQSEMTAYETMYNYWIAGQSVEVSHANLEKAQEELAMVRLEKENGAASEMDVLQSEMNLTNAEVSLEEAKQRYKMAKYQVNQKLDKQINAEWKLEKAPDVGLMPNSFYNPEMWSEDLAEHDALDTLEKSVEVYEEIVDETDSLDVIVTDPRKIREAQDDRDDAEDELEEYYKHELKVAKVQLQEQKDALQLLLHQKLDELKTLHLKIESYRSNIRKAKDMYENTKALIENGMSSQQQLTQSRLNIMNQTMQLNQAKKDYAVAKKEFHLFLNGYMPR